VRRAPLESARFPRCLEDRLRRSVAFGLTAEPPVVACRAKPDKLLERDGPPLRLDKFLKVSRLSKRRSEAKEGIDAGRVAKDERPLKAGYDVKVGDVLVIHYRTRFLTVRVLQVPDRVLPSLKPADLYEIVDDRKDDPRDWLDG
jgi:ribosomal 50S subunit-recycling heat shock protein